MGRKYEVLLFLWMVLLNVGSLDGVSLVGNVKIRSQPCNGTESVMEVFETNKTPEDENQFILSIATQNTPSKGLSTGSKIVLKFDRRVNVTDLKPNFGKVKNEGPGRVVISVTRAQTDSVSMIVRGTMGQHVPNVLSIILDGVELCSKGVKKGHWDKFIVGSEISDDPELEDVPTTEILVCGRRQFQHTPLITYAESSKEGDWPWHTAIYRRADEVTQTYICGGSLLAPTRVLTAGHCVTQKGVKVETRRLSVVVGKFNLIENDEGSQERSVFEIILHRGFEPTTYKNDIAVLVLSLAVVYTQFIQPVCLWQPELADRSSIDGHPGHVIGWGLNERKESSSILSHAVMPVVPDLTCLQSYPLFFHKFLNIDLAFCAGSRNGTSVCNGDSGGGMFFPQKSSDGVETWFLRGIVSLSVSKDGICNTDHYVLFTDAAKYLDWIEQKLN